MPAWTLQLQDNLSGPAASAATAAARLGEALTGASSASDKAETSFGKASEAASKLGESAKKASKGVADMGEALQLAARHKWDEKMSRKSALSIDKMTRSLNNGVPQINGFARAVQFMGRTFGARGAAATMAAGRAYAKYGETIGKVGSVMGSVALGAASAVAAASIGAVGLGVAAAIQIRHAQAFKESTLFAFENILKSKSEAQRVYDMAAKTSLRTGQNFEESMTSMNTLLAKGFKADFADEVLRAMSDLKTINPSANLEGIVYNIGKIQSQGWLQGDELNALSEAGLNVSDVYKKIAESMKLTAKPGQDIDTQVRKLQSAGKIKSSTAINAVMATLKDQVGGKEFGALAAQKADGSLEGLIAKAKNLGTQLMAGTNINWGPATSAIKAFMAALDSPKGKKMLDSIGAGISKVISALFGSMDQGSFEAIFDKVSEGVDKGSTALANMITLGVKLAPILGVVADVLFLCWDLSGQISGALSSVFDALEGKGPTAVKALDVALGGAITKAQMLRDTLGALGIKFDVGGVLKDAIVSSIPGGEVVSALFSDTGRAIVDGVVSGIEAGGESVYAAFSGLAAKALAAAKGAFEVNSPSKLMRREVGRHLPPGIIDPLWESQGEVKMAVNALAAEATSTGDTYSSSMTSSSSSRTIQIGAINVHGQGNGQGLGRDIRNELATLLMQT